jgi:hypothetical protein
MEAIQVVFVALIVSVFAPLILAWVTGRQQRMSKQQDWDRQDALAKRAEDAAAALAERTAAALRKSQEDAAAAVSRVSDRLAANQAEVMRRGDEVARLAAKSQAETNTQLKQIHTLVNSDMTAARQEELNQTRQALDALQRIIARDYEDERAPSEADLAAVVEKEARIEELTAILADRRVQQLVVEKEQAEAKTTADQMAADHRAARRNAGSANPGVVGETDADLE